MLAAQLRPGKPIFGRVTRPAGQGLQRIPDAADSRPDSRGHGHRNPRDSQNPQTGGIPISVLVCYFLHIILVYFHKRPYPAAVRRRGQPAPTAGAGEASCSHEAVTARVAQRFTGLRNLWRGVPQPGEPGPACSDPGLTFLSATGHDLDEVHSRVQSPAGPIRSPGVTRSTAVRQAGPPRWPAPGSRGADRW